MVAKDRPGVPLPPPLIYAAFFAAGWFWRPYEFPRWLRLGGAALIFAGFALAVWAMSLMAAAHTNVDPFRPTTAIVSRGPFARSRNPIYVAMAVMYAGAAVAFALTGALLLLPPAIAAMTVLIIRREERYLEAKFGDEYRAYRQRVRRWL